MKKINVNVKGTKYMLTSSDDGKFVKAVELANILNNNYVYSAIKAIEGLDKNIHVTKDMVVDSGKAVKFVDIQQLTAQFNKNQRKLETQLHNTLFASIKSFMTDLLNFMEENGMVRKQIENKKQPVKKEKIETSEVVTDAIDMIMDKLGVLQVEVNKKISKEQETKITNLEKELELSKAKYEELKQINLNLVTERDNLKSENNTLKQFKHGIENLMGGQR